MKYLISSLFIFTLSTSAFSAQYSPNDGKSPPGNFEAKTNETKDETVIIEREEIAPSASSETGVRTGSGVTTERVNTSPNPAPTTDKEVIDNTTLSEEETYDTGPYSKDENYEFRKPTGMEAQEEDSMDYSTTPKKMPVPKDK